VRGLHPDRAKKCGMADSFSVEQKQKRREKAPRENNESQAGRRMERRRVKGQKRKKKTTGPIGAEWDRSAEKKGEFRNRPGGTSRKSRRKSKISGKKRKESRPIQNDQKKKEDQLGGEQRVTDSEQFGGSRSKASHQKRAPSAEKKGPRRKKGGKGLVRKKTFNSQRGRARSCVEERHESRPTKPGKK